MDSITDICYDLQPNKADRIKSLYIEPLERQIEKLKSENQQYKNKLADVQPNVHGKWIKKYTDTETLAVCNNCNYPISFWHTTKYCPNCGAKMEVQNV